MLDLFYPQLHICQGAHTETFHARFWRARRDLNPGSPAPQASVLIQPRPRALSTRLLYSNNINADVKGKIVNTLWKLQNNGLEEQTVKIVGFYLNHLAVNVEIENPEKVKEFIANKNVNSGFNGDLARAWIQPSL
jgi:hypothetical protein